MPTYEFRCPAGHEFEKFYRTISAAEPELSCPECGAVAERLISGGAGFAFKGSGFYLTDYGRDAHRTRGGAAAAGAGEGTAGGEAPKGGETRAAPDAPAPVGARDRGGDSTGGSAARSGEARTGSPDAPAPSAPAGEKPATPRRPSGAGE